MPLPMILTLGFSSSPPCPLSLALPAVAQERLGPCFRVQAISTAHRVGTAEHTVETLLMMYKTQAPPVSLAESLSNKVSSQPDTPKHNPQLQHTSVC